MKLADELKDSGGLSVEELAALAFPATMSEIEESMLGMSFCSRKPLLSSWESGNDQEVLGLGPRYRSTGFGAGVTFGPVQVVVWVWGWRLKI